jgi:hypothetical protein
VEDAVTVFHGMGSDSGSTRPAEIRGARGQPEAVPAGNPCQDGAGLDVPGMASFRDGALS